MAELPSTSDSLLVRLSPTHDEAWATLTSEVETENSDGFRPWLVLVDDPDWYGVSCGALRDAVPRSDDSPMVIFAADEITLSAPDHPALVIDLMERRDPFRCVTSELWAVDNNLNLANMDWEEFASAAEDGIFRGV